MALRRPGFDLITHSPDQTRRIGYLLGRLLQGGDVILLAGPIGAGKTTFVQGLARGLGIEGYVQSPTFTLVAEHRGQTAQGEPVYLYHLDLYRLEGDADLVTFGYDEYFDAPDGIVVIEWPDRLAADLPADYLLIVLDHLADSKRRLTLSPHGARYEALAGELRTNAMGVRRGSASAGH